MDLILAWVTGLVAAWVIGGALIWLMDEEVRPWGRWVVAGVIALGYLAGFLSCFGVVEL